MGIATTRVMGLSCDDKYLFYVLFNYEATSSVSTFDTSDPETRIRNGTKSYSCLLQSIVSGDVLLMGKPERMQVEKTLRGSSKFVDVCV